VVTAISPEVGISGEASLPTEPIDFLIVGGGSAGCVLAARLSEDPATRVVLAEAGRDLTAASMPPELASAYPGRTHFQHQWIWPEIRAARGEERSNQPSEPWLYEQARILGGGSTVNGLCANRGAPTDYDEWAAKGAAGWGWADVLPYFKKLETDADFGEPLHGTSGPMPIRRHNPARWTGFTRTMAKIFADDGYAMHEDQNGPWLDGVYSTTINIDDDGRRASAAVVYLSPAVRRRPNLTILTETELEELVITGGRVEGGRFRRNGEAVTITAREVIVCTGALQTPIVLMRSGIGPPPHLAQHQIEVRVARAGVGENLQEHPSIGVAGFLHRGQRLTEPEAHHLQALVRFSSGMADVPPGDMHICVLSRGGWHAVGRRIGALACWVNRSYSKGHVRLAAGPHGCSEIDFRMLSDPRDMTRLKAGFRRIVRAMAKAREQGAVREVFPTGYSARIRELTRPNPLIAVATELAGPLMDVSATVRRRMMEFGVGTKVSPEELAADDEVLEAHLRRRVAGNWHACGSARMGDPADPLAVTDANARVIGIAGLRVCDASLMPTVPCANINIPTMMMAEKIAVTIRAGG
jgi:5-(hydroxymethyl)furfural/furfural oxidase